MLHRAASNAYSWWWASHIRTKQSKWLDNNLQDVEVKVENMLKLIEEDGDSFAQKAEMYYRKRPELIKFVEEFYRAYRALAERYDHISGELHKANKTLATVFPDQLQLSISDGEETSADKTLAAVFPDGDDEEEEEENRSSSAMVPPCLSPPMETPPLETRSKQFAGLSRESAQQEIDKLLKGILIFQTEKEFIKSCYESNLAKYWEIERKMTEMQKEVCLLQDHYSVSMAIEDDEARALMAATALKTCEAALVNLQEQQKQSMEEASLASERIRVSRGKLNSLKMAAIQEEIALDLEDSSSSETKVLSSLAMAEERLELQTMCEKIKEHFEKASVEELAEKIDELADKIIGLEVKASSQTAQIRRLRNEADELQKNLQRIEDEKTDLAAALGSYGKLRDMEEGLLQLQFLESSVKNENQKLLSDFSIACRSFVDLSERFHSGDGGCSSEQEHLKEEEEDVNEALRSIFDPDYAGTSENLQSGDCSSSQEQRRRGADSTDESISIHEDQDEEDEEEEDDGEEEREEEEEERENGIDRSEKIQLGDGGFSSPLEDFWGTEIFSSGHGEELHSQKLEEEEEEEGSLNWQQMLMSGLEDREKLLLNEYTSILRNYKETKRRLFEIEKRHQQHLSETMAKIRDLKHASAAKDEEILSLRSKLQSLECPKSPEKEERESSPPAIPAPAKEEESPEEGIFTAKEIDLQVPEEAETSNAIEERFRRDIDGLLEENLEFWLRFSASFQHIQKLQASWKSLQAEILQVGGAAASSSDTSPDSLFKNLGKLQSELLSWLDENT